MKSVETHGVAVGGENCGIQIAAHLKKIAEGQPNSLLAKTIKAYTNALLALPAVFTKNHGGSGENDGHQLSDCIFAKSKAL